MENATIQYIYTCISKEDCVETTLHSSTRIYKSDTHLGPTEGGLEGSVLLVQLHAASTHVSQLVTLSYVEVAGLTQLCLN